jgi:hypothetical protein
MIKRGALLVLALGVAASGTGCASLSNTENGALAGGAAGALIGAGVADRHHTGAGAAIGGIIGAGTGALIGKSADNDEKRAKEAAIAASAPVVGPLSLEEIATMAKAGTSDQLIINQIQASGTRYNLNGDTIVWLQQNSVSPAVISAMQATAYRPVRVVREPVYVTPAPYYYAPPPPVYAVGVRFGR